MSQDDTVLRAIGRICVQTGIPVQLTLAADYIPNTAYLDLTDASGCTVNGLISFWDGTTEQTQIISAIASNRVTLRLRHGTTGLAYAHTAGAQLATNICIYAPPRIAPMLAKGRTCVICYVDSAERDRPIHHGSQRPMVVRIQLHRSTQPDGDDETLYALDQQQALSVESQTLQLALDKHQRLEDANHNAQVVGLGYEGTKGPYMREANRPLVLDLDTPQTVKAFDVIVRPNHDIN